MLVSGVWNSSISTESSSAGTEELAVHMHPLYRAGQYIWYFVPPVLLLLGNFGNVMTIVIMRRKTSGEAVINIYFITLAIMDLISLDMNMADYWLGITFRFYLHYQNIVFCKLYHLTVAASATGGWILVCLSSQRAMSVVWPHRVNSLCTQRLVTSLIVGLAIFFAIVYSHYMYGHHLEYSNETGGYVCVMKAGSYGLFVQQIFSYIDLVLYSLLPFCCIFMANAVLVWKLRATLREIRHKFAKRETAVAAREKAASSVTLTILLVSVAFVVLTLPASVYYITLYVYDPSLAMSASEVARSHFTRAITFMFMYSNSAVNFYLYCLTGTKFREEFLNMFSPRR